MGRILTILLIIFLGAAIVYGSRSYFVSGATVIDNHTGLRWTRCSMLSGETIDVSRGCTGNPVKYTWEGAINACEHLELAGISNWRLPNVRELQSIATHYRFRTPMIDPRVFPNTVDGQYWSSTTYNESKTDVNPDAGDYAWVFDFYYANITPVHKEYGANHTAYEVYVRCVSGP